MIIDCISDMHGQFPKLEGGDLLIIAGDCTSNDTIPAWNHFFNWLDKQDYKNKVMVAGNHDNWCKQWATSDDSIHDILEGRPSVSYLCDSGMKFDYWPELPEKPDNKIRERKTFKIWGTPWTKTFKGMNPKCKSFTCDTEEELEEKFSLIPNDTDILISHGPMLHVLDQNIDGYSCGSYTLREEVERIMPMIFVCGHIHEQGGQMLLYKHYGPNTICVNASYMDEKYKPVHKPVRIII